MQHQTQANMPTATEIIDMFAAFQKAIGREVGELMGTLIDASTPRSAAAAPVDTPAASAPAPDITGPLAALESRIMASIDARLAALEARMTPVSGRKRSRETTPPESEVEDTDTEDNEAGVGAAPNAPIKGQTTLTRFVQEAKVMADLASTMKKLEMGAPAPAPGGQPVPLTPSSLPAPMKEESEASEAEEEASDAEASEAEASEAEASEAEASEAEASEAEEEAEEGEEELTQITYKGKDYGMDGDGNIYGFDAEGDLIEEPIGKMDSKTNRITFFAA